MSDMTLDTDEFRGTAFTWQTTGLMTIQMLPSTLPVFALMGFSLLQTMAPHQWIFFSGGILVMLSGLYLLTPENHPPPDPEIPPEPPARTPREEVRV